MERKRLPLAFSLEPDGSVCVLAVPPGWKKGEAVKQLGHVKRLPRGFLYTQGFQEALDYDDWDEASSGEDAVQKLVEEVRSSMMADMAAMSSGDGDASPDEEDRQALAALDSVVFDDAGHLSRKLSAALVAAARDRVRAAVIDMLLVSSYDETLAAFQSAVVAEVIGS